MCTAVNRTHIQCLSRACPVLHAVGHQHLCNLYSCVCMLLSSHSLVPPPNSRRVPPLKADNIDNTPTKCPTLRHTSWWRLDTVLAVCWSVELQKDCLVVYTLTSGREGAGEDLTLEERLAHTILIFVFSQPSSFALESVQYVCLCQEVQCKLKSISVEYCVYSLMPPP